MKILMKGDKVFYVKDVSKDYHCQFGLVKASQFVKGKPGDRLTTNKGVELTLLDAGFLDLYKRIKRGPQIIARKEVGMILTETGVGAKSIVVDAGSGSGALTCYLAHYVKKVVSYEVREDFHSIVKKNVEFLGLKNVKLKNKDIYLGIDESPVDLITLDLPEPWKVIEHAVSSLKVGGYLVSYSPTVPQVMDFVEAVKKKDEFVHVKTVELLLREWEVEGRKVRPMSRMTGHTGFLTFVRRL